VNGADPSWSKIEPEAALELEFKMAMAIVTKSRAHILGHPMGMVVTRFNLRPLEQLYELAEACCAYDKAFELNTRYCANSQDWIDIVRRAGCKVSFGSDAHKVSDVGSAWQIFMRQGTEAP
jgi:histidinol phosphatase-like PHP family hydrolase